MLWKTLHMLASVWTLSHAYLHTDSFAIKHDIVAFFAEK